MLDAVLPALLSMLMFSIQLAFHLHPDLVLDASARDTIKGPFGLSALSITTPLDSLWTAANDGR